MDDNSKVLLDTLLAHRAKELDGEPLPDDQLFELFALEQVLKEGELAFEEIAAGQVGGGDDGGIDGIYTFLDGVLLEDDAEVLQDDFDPRKVKSGVELALLVVQAKREASFSEKAVQVLADTIGEVLDLSKDEDSLREVLSGELVERAQIFRGAWERLATRHPRVTVQAVYATKGDCRDVNDKVRARGNRLVAEIEEMNSKASGEVSFLGARELVDLAAQEKSYTLQLIYQEMATAERSHLVLIRLDDYLNFIAENGQLRKHIFDWNVRDYEGGVEVNREIADTLSDHDAPEFWWLNNGVTVICSNASSQGKKLSLDEVQVVNGLQTSVSIFNYLKEAPADDPARDRSILVRVVSTQDPDTRDRIIRATNRQTMVQPASLRATDAIQRDLERYFLSHDWYYERRKNYYRNQGRPSARIVPIPYLAQAILAMGFSEPSNSRARPSSLLKRDADYSRIFDPTLDYAIFLWLAIAQKMVDATLRSAKLQQKGFTNLRFHIAMATIARKYGGRVYNPQQLKGLVEKPLEIKDIADASKEVAGALQALLDKGGDQQFDKVVKNKDFTDHLLAHMFPPDPE